MVVPPPSKINFHEKKVGIGATPERGNFTITTKTNPYGKITTFLTYHQYNPGKVIYFHSKQARI